MLTVTGKLPNGIEFNGQVHSDFELREQMVADTVEILESAEHGHRANTGDYYFNVCVMAKRLVRLGEIPTDAITPDFVMGMTQEDFNELSLASKRLSEKRRNFRGAAGAA